MSKNHAKAQLRRIENALARDSYPQIQKERHMASSIENIIESFNVRYNNFRNGDITIEIDEAMTEGLDKEIFINLNYQKYPLRSCSAMISELTNVIRDYSFLNNRNKKKDVEHLNKHLMHLVRLYLMAFDILENGQIKTYREFDLELLMDIRNGKYLAIDGLTKKMSEMIDGFEKRLYQLKETSLLPEKPDFKKIEKFLIDINLKALQLEAI